MWQKLYPIALMRKSIGRPSFLVKYCYNNARIFSRGRKPVSPFWSQSSISIPPENVRKPEVFWHFYGLNRNGTLASNWLKSRKKDSRKFSCDTILVFLLLVLNRCFLVQLQPTTKNIFKFVCIDTGTWQMLKICCWCCADILFVKF